MGKNRNQTKQKIDININATDTINEKVFSDITRVSLEFDDENGVRLHAFGYLMYNDGTKDVKVDNINIEMNNTELTTLLGTQLTDLEAIIEKVALNKVAEKLKLQETDFEKKDKKNNKVK